MWYGLLLRPLGFETSQQAKEVFTSLRCSSCLRWWYCFLSCHCRSLWWSEMFRFHCTHVFVHEVLWVSGASAAVWFILRVMAWVISWALSMNSTADLSPKCGPWSMSYLREWYMCRRISHWMISWSTAWFLKTKPGIKLCSCFLCSFFHAPLCGWIMWWYIKHSYISVISHDSWFRDLEERWNSQRLGDNVWNSLSFEKG